MAYKYYSSPSGAEILAGDIPADVKEIRKLLNSKSLLNCNAFIDYQDSNLKSSELINTTTLSYLGHLDDYSENVESGIGINNYLWVGNNKISKAQFIKAAGLKDHDIRDIKLYYTKQLKRVDEIIILEVEDIELAEHMILKAAASGIPTEANTMVFLCLNNDITLNGDEIGSVLDINFAGSFSKK